MRKMPVFYTARHLSAPVLINSSVEQMKSRKLVFLRLMKKNFPAFCGIPKHLLKTPPHLSQIKPFSSDSNYCNHMFGLLPIRTHTNQRKLPTLGGFTWRSLLHQSRRAADATDICSKIWVKLFIDLFKVNYNISFPVVIIILKWDLNKQSKCVYWIYVSEDREQCWAVVWKKTHRRVP